MVLKNKKCQITLVVLAPCKRTVNLARYCSYGFVVVTVELPAHGRLGSPMKFHLNLSTQSRILMGYNLTVKQQSGADILHVYQWLLQPPHFVLNPQMIKHTCMFI